MEPDVSPPNSTCSKPSNLPIALFTLECNSKKRLLFDLSTKQTRGITNAVFPDATFAFENGGWLLMVQNNRHGFQEQALQTVSLFHAGTGRQIDLPAFHPVVDGLFVFYVDAHGTPLIVACIETISKFPTIHVACPGDVYWSTYMNMDASHLQQVRHRQIKCTLMVDVALHGKQAICVGYHGRILIFDMFEMAWRTPVLSPEWSEQDAHFLVASGEEELFLISCRRCGEWFCAFKFFKLDATSMAWSPIDDAELDGFSWFLYRGSSFRVRKEEGERKVYTFCPNQWGGSTPIDAASSRKRKVAHGKSGPLTEKSITNIYVHNLVDGVVEKLLPTSILTEARHWVHSVVFSETSV